MSNSSTPKSHPSADADEAHNAIIKEMRKLERALKDVRPRSPHVFLSLTLFCRLLLSSRSWRPAPSSSLTKIQKLRAKMQCGSRCSLCSSSILKQLPSLQLY